MRGGIGRHGRGSARSCGWNEEVPEKKLMSGVRTEEEGAVKSRGCLGQYKSPTRGADHGWKKIEIFFTEVSCDITTTVE